MYASRSLTKRIGHILASLFALLSVQGICAQTFVAGLPLLDNRLTAATFLYKVVSLTRFFSAKIQANRITDVRTLVKDPRIEYVHWMISSK